jgi:predicted PurR-regulated permease PerM
MASFRPPSKTEMKRSLSLYLLLATVVLIGILFYQVIQPFIFSLLFSAVLAVIFRPAYDWMLKKLKGRRRLAGGITTAAILMLLLVPIGGALVVAGFQLVDFTRNAVLLLQDPPKSELYERWQQVMQTPVAEAIETQYQALPPNQQLRIRELGEQAAQGLVRQVYERTIGIAGDVVMAFVGLVVTSLGLYYSLVDGDQILRLAKDLSPLDESVEDALIDNFGRVCRGVVMGTLAAALAQSMLAGLGFWVAGISNVLLLMVVTMVFAFIPFMGAGSVVTAMAIWIAIDGRYVAAGLLLAYGLLVVSLCDNAIRAYVIGSEAKMNPLVAFITVIGAIQLIGLWGILVGPLVAALFYTLLKLLQGRLTYESMVQAEALRES